MNIAQDTEAVACRHCEGKGTVKCVDKSPANNWPIPCPACRGSKKQLACVGQTPTPPGPFYDGPHEKPFTLRIAS